MVGQNFLDKWQRRFGRYAIHHLMNYIVGAMALVFVMDLVLFTGRGVGLSSLLAFNRQAILQGQIWRIVTFMFIPPNASLIFILFSLYFYWMIGTGLENQWGAFKFNVYYFCGAMGTILAGLITGHATNQYLNLSLFLAFALMYPNFELLLFFVLPVKMKYLAILDAAGLAVMLILESWPGKVALLVAVANVLLFFWRDFYDVIHDFRRRRQFQKNMRNHWRP